MAVGKINEIEIKSFDELITKLSDENNCGHHVFRGVRSASFDLKPSVGRLAHAALGGMSLEDYERETLSRFKLRFRSELSTLPLNDWEWLTVSQHHGLPTRLLDWTTNPLVAAYFATEPQLKFDGTIEVAAEGSAIYRLHTCNHEEASELCPNPFDCLTQGIFLAPHLTKRITGQSGLFSFQPDATKTFDDGFLTKEANTIDKFIMNKDVSLDAQKKLYRLGIRHSLIYPDIDGFSKELRVGNNFSECHIAARPC
jgi:FRG domain